MSIDAINMSSSLTTGRVGGGSTKGVGAWDQFANMLTDQIKETESMRAESKELTKKALLGNAGVSLHEAQIASARTEVQTRFMVEVRNKALEAYKQVMSMPI